MRFFTLDWWCGIQGCDDVGDPGEAYREHLATIRDRLPPSLLALQESFSLHDGRLRLLELLVAAGTLEMVVDGDDGSGGFRRFTLRYGCVKQFESTADPTRGLPGPLGYGDWGYDEVYLREGGLYEHRILFSSGIELVVRFMTFELSWSAS